MFVGLVGGQICFAHVGVRCIVGGQEPPIIRSVHTPDKASEELWVTLGVPVQRRCLTLCEALHGIY